MRRRAGVKPSKTASAFAVFVGIGMACFGLFALSQLSSKPKPTGFSDLPGSPGPSGSPGDSFGTIFIIFWLICLVGIIIYHLRNALSDDAPPVEIVDYDMPTASSPPSAANQLRELEQLKRENLISQAEYEQKRKEIMNRL